MQCKMSGSTSKTFVSSFFFFFFFFHLVRSFCIVVHAISLPLLFSLSLLMIKLPCCRVLHKFLSPLDHTGKVKYEFVKKNTCPNYIFTCPKKKKVIFVLKVICPHYTFSLPNSGNCYFLDFLNACPNLTFTCPRQSGKCLCSTLLAVFKDDTQI